MKSVPPPRRPYFLRAMHDWISDAGQTPQIIVNAHAEGVHVPAGYSDEAGRIVLNIGLEAVRNLALTNEAVSCEARFGGVAYSIHVPTGAILGIYARETGEGIAFGNEEGEGETAGGEETGAPKGKPSLKIVK